MTIEVVVIEENETIIEEVIVTEVVEVDCDTIEIIDIQTDTILVEKEITEIVIVDDVETVIEVEDITEVVEVAEQGPIGPPGGLTTNQENTIVGAGDAETIGTVALATKRSIKWFITVTDSVNGLFAFSEVAAIHNDTTVFWTHYAKVGDPLNYTVSVLIQGFQVILTVKNDEAVNVEFSVLQIVTNVV